MDAVCVKGCLIQFCFVAVLAVLALCPIEAAAQDEAPNVDRMIAQIRNEPSAHVRTLDAHKLFMLLKGLDERGEAHTVTDSAIDDLATLLADDAVVLTVVASVRFLDFRVVRLVPALEAAHRRNCARLQARNCAILGHDGTFMIEGVLKEITGHGPTCCPEFDA